MDRKPILGGVVELATEWRKDNLIIFPDFVLSDTSDVMIKGSDFYAVWIEERGLWSTKETDFVRLVDAELYKFAEEIRSQQPGAGKITVQYLRYTRNGGIDRWHKYCKQQQRDIYHALDGRLVFANEETTKKDYASKRLPYALMDGPTPGWDSLVSVLYSPEERRKLEWAIGAVVSGDSRKIQKFVALYGPGGTGKSTVLRVIEQLFDGYCCTFNAKSLGSSNNSFALEAFRNNPLVAIEDDSKLSKIDDNTRLNSLVAHESMLINEKFKSQYENSFKAFLFIGTNEPVMITDAKSGLIRRLIDISPTGETLDRADYEKAKAKIPFELGAIAKHCLDVYNEDPRYYDKYVPVNMMGATNDFYNFIADRGYFVFSENNGTTATAAWKLYKEYCEEANMKPKSYMKFKDELKNYFDTYSERSYLEDGTRVRGYYSGFKTDIFDRPMDEKPKPEPKPAGLDFQERPSILDEELAECPAQYAGENGTPSRKWENVKTVLADLDTAKLHYVKLPKNHIVIDFDIPDENGEKSLEKNLTEASKWPETYAELSKSGKGIHLHYIYDGDPSKLASLYAPHIEIKVPTGNSSLRRMLTRCTAATIAHICSGLPLKGEKPPMMNSVTIKSERSLRRQIERNLNREIHPNTKPSIDMIEHILEDAYNSGLQYDVSDMRNAVFQLACQSTHQRDYCMTRVTKMKFKSAQPPEAAKDTNERPMVFFDCEVFPNLLVICWKLPGEDQPVHHMINPEPAAVEDFIDSFDLVGFNNRRYDNHIIYARSLGVSIEGIFKLSDSMINHKTGFLGQAYDISYTDIYDFSSKKQGLKKFEIELKIDHRELDLPWDQPAPEDRWDDVVTYCEYDVLATEKTFFSKDRQADFAGRKILAKLANGTVNDTTNSLSTRFIFGNDKHPQDQFNYRFMGDVPEKVYRSVADAKKGVIFNHLGDEYTLFDEQGRPVFPGYTYDSEKRLSMYRGVEVGEGGRVSAQPGIYFDVALLDVESMHPHSAIAETLFGEYYTARFKEIVDARLAIKHGDLEKARSLLNGELAPYLDDKDMLKGLKQALKIVINSVYGLTAAKFMNAFRDPRNVDNIVAKRGALFMINLEHEVARRGFVVAHIKTDSIKIPNADLKIIKFVQDYGEMYGYHFLHEATYEKMCLVNDAVYIAKYATPEWAQAKYGYIPVDLEEHGGEWTATGAQFAVPYVFKTLFTNEKILFDDLCETKSVTSALYLDMNEDLPDVSDLEKQYDKERKKDRPDEELLTYLEDEIAKGHHYHFVGRVGRFCPIKEGYGGGLLMRTQEDKRTGEISYNSATGTKGYRWLEAETVIVNEWSDRIDISYYDQLVDDARAAIGEYGDVDAFIEADSDFPFVDIPPWEESTDVKLLA